MDNNSKPFDQLSEDDQKAATDVAVATVVIGLRIPTAGKQLYDFIATEFASCRTIPRNIAKYSLRGLGESLFEQNWTMTITKKQGKVTTFFTPEPDGQESNDSTIIIQ